jgi:hypothetical protein
MGDCRALGLIEALQDLGFVWVHGLNIRRKAGLVNQQQGP